MAGESGDYRELDFEQEKPTKACEATGLAPIVPGPGGRGMFTLRDYQEEAVHNFFECLNESQSSLMVMATGLGKTVAMAEIAIRWPADKGRVLIIAHTEELIDQAADKVGRHLDQECGIEMGDRREVHGGFAGQAKVLVASVQTLVRDNRRRRFKPDNFGLVLVDEAHRSTAKSYRTVLKHFLQNPNCRIGGVTATPDRTDKSAMGDIYRSVCVNRDLIWGIANGWLVPVRQKLVTVKGLDFSACRTTGGDINEKDLESAMLGGMSLQEESIAEQEAMLHRVAKPVIDEAAGRPCMIFCVTVNHAERMADVCNRYDGVSAEVVTGTTPKERRLDIINQFRAGRLQILCVVAIGVEGFDARVDVVAIAKPTKSKLRYCQMVGRGTRPLPGTVDDCPDPNGRKQSIAASQKPAMTVLDFVGVAGRHSLVSAVDILGGNYSEDVIAAAKAEMTKTGETVDVVERLLMTQSQQEEAKRQRLAREAAKKKAEEEEEARRIAEAESRRRIRANVSYETENIPLDRVIIPDIVGVGVYRGGSTDKQIRYLMRLGVRHDDACRMGIKQASAVIDSLKKRTGAEFIMTVGPHMGKPLREVPRGYLDAFVRHTAMEDVKENYREMMKPKKPVVHRPQAPLPTLKTRDDDDGWLERVEESVSSQQVEECPF